jgi:MoaA/NifB/PqqE/SkfB family radical SAM enzyme
MSLERLAWNLAVSQNAHDPAQCRRDVARLSKKGECVINLTTRCNFSCKHCLRDLSNPKDFPFDLLEKIVLGAKHFGFGPVVSLTGGEPLLYPRFRDVINFFAENDIPFNISTNGFIFESVSDLLEQNKKHIQFLQFSLEDTDEKKHDDSRNAGSFKKLLNAAQFCRDRRIPFRFMTAVSTANDEKIFDIALFAKKKGAYTIALTTVLPCPHAQQNHLVLDENKRNQIFLNALPMSKILKFPVTLTAAIRTQGILRFCAGISLGEIAFDVDGNVTQCCDLANFDDQDIRARAIITSARDKTFKDILLACAEHARKCDTKRIQDCQDEPDPNAVDFNSCFYCLRK